MGVSDFPKSSYNFDVTHCAVHSNRALTMLVISHGWVRMMMLQLAGYLTDLSKVGHTHPSMVMSLGQIINKRTLEKV